jgi:hypothetical protein
VSKWHSQAKELERLAENEMSGMISTQASHDNNTMRVHAVRCHIESVDNLISPVQLARVANNIQSNLNHIYMFLNITRKSTTQTVPRLHTVTGEQS